MLSFNVPVENGYDFGDVVGEDFVAGEAHADAVVLLQVVAHLAAMARGGKNDSAHYSGPAREKAHINEKNIRTCKQKRNDSGVGKRNCQIKKAAHESNLALTRRTILQSLVALEKRQQQKWNIRGCA